jgi:hypothetical protein
VNAAVSEADLVLYYPIADSWRHDFVRSSYVKQAAKNSLSLTNIFFEGLHPDVTLVGKGGQRLQSPLADYHSRAALFGYRAGLSAAELCKKVRDENFAESVGYRSTWDDSIKELYKRSNLCDINYGHRFEEIMKTRLPLFVVNHPVTYVLVDYVNFIMRQIEQNVYSIPADCFPQWMLSNAVFPVFNYISEWHSLPYQVELFKAPKREALFSLDEFIIESYAMYGEYKSDDMAIMTGYQEKWKERFSKVFECGL